MNNSTILVDTSILIDHLRGNSYARTALLDARQSGRRMTSSVLTRTEILGGIRSPEKTRTLALLNAFDWITVDDPIADEAGSLVRIFRKSHSGIDIADYVIAATALTIGATLWTRNVKHFPMFQDLTPPY